MTGKKVTIEDVAKVAGVSIATVSRSLSGNSYVSASTKSKIDKAIAKLGYYTNAAARQTATGKSNTIGICVIGSSLSGPASILSAVESTARKLGFTAIVSVVDEVVEAQPVHESEIIEIFNRFFEANVDAIICVQSERESAEMLYNIQSKVPVFFAVSDHHHGDSGKFFVTVDQRSGVAKAIHHLRKYKHHRLLYFPGPKGSLDGDIRLDEVRSQCREHKIHLNIIETGSWDSKNAYFECCEYFSRLKHHDRPTAIFTGNDLQAFGVLRALHDLGIKVPKDVSLVGFDNYPGTNYTLPSLTTVEQPYTKLGKRIMQAVHDLLDGEKIPSLQMIEPKLIERESTDVAKR